MECNFYDRTLTKIGVINDFVSMRWNEQYSDTGGFYLVANKDAEALSLMKVGNFVGVRRYSTLMYIYSIEDKKDQLWAYGAEAKWLLKQRVYDGTLVCRNVEDTLKTAVMATRPLPIFGVTADAGLTGTLHSQRSYTSLFDMSKAWCDAVGYGFRMVHDRANKELLYDIYSGQVQSNAVFSNKFRNMQNLVRIQSEKQMANVATVLGSGEGDNRIKVTVGDTTATGFDRSEIVIDARDLVFDEETETQTQYEEKLESRGREKLAGLVAIDDITFEVDASDFGTVFNLGDMIRCSLPEYNLSASTRVTGFTTTYESNVETTMLSLGTPILRSTISSPFAYGTDVSGGATVEQDAQTGVLYIT